MKMIQNSTGMDVGDSYARAMLTRQSIFGPCFSLNEQVANGESIHM